MQTDPAALADKSATAQGIALTSSRDAVNHRATNARVALARAVRVDGGYLLPDGTVTTGYGAAVRAVIAWEDSARARWAAVAR